MERTFVSSVARLALLSGLLGPISNAHAQNYGAEIAWASDAFAVNLMADGVTTFEESGLPIYFELGTFESGFDPRSSSPDEWAAHWVGLQQAIYDAVNKQVIQTATLPSNEAPFAINGQAYIWGYTQMHPDPAESAEWILLAADEWRWPVTGVLMPTTFSVADADLPSEMILGSVNGNASGRFYHMMLTTVTAVPEPSALLMAAFSAGFLAIRRRR